MYWLATLAYEVMTHDFFLLPHVFLRIEELRSKQTVRTANFVHFLDCFMDCFMNCFMVFMEECHTWDTPLPILSYYWLDGERWWFTNVRNPCFALFDWSDLHWEEKLPSSLFLFLISFITYALQAQGYVLLFLQLFLQVSLLIVVSVKNKVVLRPTTTPKPNNLDPSFPNSLKFRHSSQSWPLKKASVFPQLSPSSIRSSAWDLR